MTNLTTHRSGAAFFLREWLSDPLRVAAVAPSGKTLARLITEEISPGTGKVIELGPGTGVFTRALLAQGVAPQDLALVELGESFAANLRRQFPSVAVYHQSAADLEKIAPFSAAKAGAVVSGLGLLAMPDEVVGAILDGVFHHLGEGRAFYQFTYSWRCPVKPELMEERGLQARQTGRTFRNIPPAQVYKITRK